MKLNRLFQRAALALCIAGFSMSDAKAIQIAGIEAGNILNILDTDNPLNIISSVPLVGLSPGQLISTLDFNSLTGELLGVTNDGLPVNIDLVTGLVSPAGGLLPILDDLLGGGELNVLTGLLETVNELLGFAPGDLNFGQIPDLIGLASTTDGLFAIDGTLNSLVQIVDGVLETIGIIDIPGLNVIGFDALSTSTGLLTNLLPSGLTELFAIDLQTGEVTLLGETALNLNDITIIETGILDLDGDGVVDSVDICPGTPAQQVVDSKGCAILGAKQLCPCSARRNGQPYLKRKDFKKCVKAETKRFQGLALLSKQAAKAVKKAAKASGCPQ